LKQIFIPQIDNINDFYYRNVLFEKKFIISVPVKTSLIRLCELNGVPVFMKSEFDEHILALTNHLGITALVVGFPHQRILTDSTILQQMLRVIEKYRRKTNL